MKTAHGLLISLILVFGCSCGDFFEENSQNQAYVGKVEDLNELLMGEAYINREGFDYTMASFTASSRIMAQTRFYFPWIHLVDDDITEFADKNSTRVLSSTVRENAFAAYAWQPNPFVNMKGEPYEADEWKNTYKRIGVLNSILYELDELREGEEDQTLCDKVEGEAAFLRAYYYYWLINLFAQPYALSTAENEAGVPLKISEVVEDKLFARSSVKTVYEQIKKDLTRSIAAFRHVPTPERPIKANYTSACLLMSRVCLYTEDYEGAIAYADSAILRGEHVILDLNTLTDGSTFTDEESPETVFYQGGSIMGAIHTDDRYMSFSPEIQSVSSYKTSDDLLKCYVKNDLRKNCFFINPSIDKTAWRCIKFRKTTGRMGDYMLFRIPEAYLNKAEAQAILGRDEEAKTTLNILREKRFIAGQMPPIETEMENSDETLVNFIRSERRRELCYEGHRWFDLRRYAVNSKYPFEKSIIHNVRELRGDATTGSYVDAGYYELKPYSQDRAAYVFPLPADEIVFNEGVLIQNAARPERSMQTY